MEVWLKGSRVFQFPVNPAEYTVTSERGDETVDINAIGEIDLGGNRRLKTVSFSSFFPSEWASYCQYSGFGEPMECVETIQKIMDGEPAKLIITETPVRMPCRITSFTWGERDGSGDIYFDITLTEHRRVSSSSSTVAADEEIAKRAMPPLGDIVTTVQEGETTSAVARRTTGSAKNKKDVVASALEALGTSPAAGTLVRVPGANRRRKITVTAGLGVHKRAKTSTVDTTTTVDPYGETTLHYSSSGVAHGGGLGGRKF